MKRMNTAVVGFGFMGGMHAQIYRQLATAKLVAVVDTQVEKAQSKARELKLDVTVFPDMDALLAGADVDVIDICGPTDTHVGLALQTAEAGKHLFIEKPLALSLDSCDRIIEAVAKHNVTAQVGHCIRFWPEYKALEKFIAGGTGGALKSLSMLRRAARPAYSQFNWLNDRKRGGGAAFDLHIHDTDFALHLLGTPRSVFSSATQSVSGPDHIFTTYHFDDVSVHAEGGWNYPVHYGFRMAFEAVFEHACVGYDSTADPTLKLTFKDRPTEPLAFEQPGAGESSTGEGNLSSLGGYYNELEYFTNCLQAGKAPEIATLAQARESVRVVLAELESAESGSPVAL